jgi:hypothetical protein
MPGFTRMFLISTGLTITVAHSIPKGRDKSAAKKMRTFDIDI